MRTSALALERCTASRTAHASLCMLSRQGSREGPNQLLPCTSVTKVPQRCDCSIAWIWQLRPQPRHWVGCQPSVPAGHLQADKASTPQDEGLTHAYTAAEGVGQAF